MISFHDAPNHASPRATTTQTAAVANGDAFPCRACAETNRPFVPGISAAGYPLPEPHSPVGWSMNDQGTWKRHKRCSANAWMPRVSEA